MATRNTQERRALVRTVMLDIRQRWPLARLTEKLVASRLPFQIPRPTLYRDMEAIIRAESNTDTSDQHTENLSQSNRS